MNVSRFYQSIRIDLFDGKLNQAQVNNCNAILAEYERTKINNLRALAYIFATVYHETGASMQPIKEYDRGGNRDYAKVIKEGNRTYMLDYGAGPGRRVRYEWPKHIYFGRGHVQVTWLRNYKALTIAARAQGFTWDFVNSPDLLLQIEPSIWAAFYGMRTGLFTGAKLSNYFTDSRFDNYHARQIINGTDKAVTIAAYADTFYKALIIK